MALPDWIKPVDKNADKSEMPDWIKPVEKPESFGTEALNAINQVGGTVAHAIGYGAQDFANIPVALGNEIRQGLGQTSEAPFDTSKLPMPGVSQERQTQLEPYARGLATAAEWAPLGIGAAKLGTQLATVGGKALLEKLGSASALKNLNGQNIEAATQKFGADAKNTLTDLFGESKITPRDELQQNTHEALQQMYGTPDYKNMIGNENEILSQKVQGAHNKNYAEGSARFEKTLADTNPVVSPEDAHIKPREGSQLDKAMQMNPLLADKIITANQSPTLRNLHEVQSQMGAIIADKKTVPYSQRDNESINLLQGLRDKIVNNISAHAPEYKNDQAFWRNNVIPYYENSSINNLVRKNIVPSNISNILSKPELPTQRNELPGTVNTILSHLSPQDKQLIPAAKLAGSQNNPLMDLSGNINEDNFAKGAQGLTNKNLSQFVTPAMRQKLQGLGQDLKNAKLHDAITNNVKDIAGNINPDELVKNIKELDSSLISPIQKATLQQSLSKLTESSENIKKEQLKTEAIKKLLKRSGWAAGILAGIETGRRIL